jgi:hypothetical protein
MLMISIVIGLVSVRLQAGLEPCVYMFSLAYIKRIKTRAIFNNISKYIFSMWTECKELDFRF